MNRIEYEKYIVELMVRLYCRRKEGHRDLCEQCQTLLDYAHRRLEHCRFGERKPTCRQCPVHCYKPDMKQRMREVMRWSGPRMMLYHPIEAVRHMIREWR